MEKAKESITYTYRSSWVALVRPMTLTGSISPAIAGTFYAAKGGSIDYLKFFVFLAAVLLVQMAVNTLNDYFDFLNGQDREKWQLVTYKSTFDRPAISQLPKVAGTMLFLSAGLGIWLAAQSSFWILFIGVFSISAGIWYSAGKPSLSSIGAGELVAAIFLGFVVTALAHIVGGGNLDWTVAAISVPYAFLIASMIMVNNIRDIRKDLGFRRTLAIALGRRKTLWLLSFFLAVPYLWLFVLMFTGIAGAGAAIALCAMPIALQLRWNMREEASQAEKEIAMKWSAWHHWAFGLLFAFGL